MGFTSSQGNYHSFRSVLPLSLNDFREVDANGDVGAITANGGILASDTTPILRGASSIISQELSWAASNVDAILAQLALPEDFDGREDVLLDLWVYGGTTDLASFAVSTSWDGGATVSDTATDAAASATIRKVTARIAAADIPDSASFLTLMLAPATHGTNATQLVAARLSYVPRITS